MGLINGNDFASWEINLCINRSDLARIMSWAGREDCFYDYELTELQVKALEEVCLIALPRGFLFYLTTSGE
jgi:hypothetical protein